MIDIVAKEVTRNRRFNPLFGRSVERQAIAHIENYRFTLDRDAQRDFYRSSSQHEEVKLSLSRLEHILADPIAKQELITACANILRLIALQEIL